MLKVIGDSEIVSMENFSKRVNLKAEDGEYEEYDDDGWWKVMRRKRKDKGTGGRMIRSGD